MYFHQILLKNYTLVGTRTAFKSLLWTFQKRSSLKFVPEQRRNREELRSPVHKLLFELRIFVSFFSPILGIQHFWPITFRISPCLFRDEGSESRSFSHYVTPGYACVLSDKNPRRSISQPAPFHLTLRRFISTCLWATHLVLKKIQWRIRNFSGVSSAARISDSDPEKWVRPKRSKITFVSPLFMVC